MKISIHSRILFSALVVLILFMTLTSLVLDKGFRGNVERAQRENLRTQIYTLLATAELDDDNTLQLPADIPEPRLNIPESNLHARVMTVNKKSVWRSKSMLNMNINFPKNIVIGKLNFTEFSQNNESYTLLNFATQWVNDAGEKTFIFQIAENKNVFDSQITLFRKNLWGWLGGVSLVLIIIQTLILRWGLKPLRHVAEDLVNIEKGNAKNLVAEYPKELTPLTNNLNQLLNSSQQQLTRYRDALGNMAHSLKTPIAVLQGIVEATSGKEKEIALEQLNTINNIVEYQLQRAATVGRLQLANSILLLPVVEKIISSLEKVHKDKNITVAINIPSKLSIKLDQGDLYELLGNLLENSFKWCNTKVSISSTRLNEKIEISIEDDGPGINKNEQERILLRGQRADQNTPGHGLGLAMVNNILLLYKGEMRILSSDMGGAKIIIKM